MKVTIEITVADNEENLAPLLARIAEQIEDGYIEGFDTLGDTVYRYTVSENDPDPEAQDWANGYGGTAAVDADALASAGMGTDEDYGCYGGDE
jgi:hypothetical protein